MSFILGQTCAPAKLVVCLLFMQWWIERCLLSCVACIVFAVQIRQRVSQILSIRGGSVKAIKSIMRGKIVSSLQSFCTPATVLPVYLAIF